MINKSAKIKVALINGALRKLSNNKGLGRIVESVKPSHIDLIHIQIGDLPIMNEDLQVKSESTKQITLPPAVNRIRQTVRNCQAMIFTSPEYNGGITGPLKNAYDWLSRDYSAFGNPKPIGKQTKLGIVGASYLTQNSIKDVIRMVQFCKVNVYNETYYTKLGKSFDQSGDLANNNSQKQRLIGWANNFYKWVEETNKNDTKL